MPLQFMKSEPPDVESETTSGSLKRRTLTDLEEFDEDGHIKRTGAKLFSTLAGVFGLLFIANHEIKNIDAHAHHHMARQC